VLVCVEVDAVDGAGGGDGSGVEEVAGVFCGDMGVGGCEADASLRGALELWRDGALWCANERRADYEDGRSGIPSSMGAVRISLISVAMPCEALKALFQG
jgi:hypothetical protein